MFCRKIPLLALSDNILEEFFLNNLLRKGPLVLLDFFFLTNFATNHVACVSSIITYLSVSWKLLCRLGSSSPHSYPFLPCFLSLLIFLSLILNIPVFHFQHVDLPSVVVFFFFRGWGCLVSV